MELPELKNKIEESKKTLEELEILLDVDALDEQISALEAKTYDQGFWDDHERATKVIEALKQLRHQRGQYEGLIERLENLELMQELLEIGENVEALDEDVKAFDAELEKFETSVYLSEPYDQFNAIIEIHPGAGGTESHDWAEMLYKMLTRYVEKSSFRVTVNDYQDGLEAGIKSVTFTVTGPYAFGYLKSESGVHRLVRISPFDSSGRRHTSFASVNVIPEIDATIDIDLQESDLKIDTYRSSGAGGQSVNTTDSAVRITHLPTKMVVTCQNERSQIKNRAKALQILKGKLYQRELEIQKEALSNLKNINQSNAFGSQIRSYVMHPYTLVKDHRTDVESGNVDKVLDGDIGRFIHHYLRLLAKEDSENNGA